MKDWLNDIQEKVGGYEVKPSEDLIREMEAKGILTPERRSKRHVLPVWARYAVPCAVAAALAFFLLINNNGIRTIDNPALPSIEMAPLSSKPELLAEASLPKPKALYLKERVIAGADEIIIPSSNSDDNPNCDTLIPDEPAVQSPRVKDKTVEKDTDISYVDPFAFPDEERKPGRKSAVSLALLGAIGTQSTYSPQTADMQNRYNSNSGADWGGSPVMAMMLCSASFEEEEEVIEETYSHRLPLKFGISVEYTMNDRWSVTSGLNYSFLESNIYDSNGHVDKLGVQKLSYLGIPVNVKFNAFRAGVFNAYLTAGGIAEYCIAGRRENFCNVSGIESNTVEKYSEHPFQFSMNASAGAEYSFLSYMSLFAEVGASYYFNDGSPVQTIYKEKPLYFNTNIGIRFKFGK